MWIREIAKVLLWGVASGVLFYIPVIPAYGSALWTDKRRTWHDLLARTIVVVELESTRERARVARERREQERMALRLEREASRTREKAQKEREAAERRAQQEREAAERRAQQEREQAEQRKKVEAEQAAWLEIEQAGQTLVRELWEHRLEPHRDWRSPVDAFLGSHPRAAQLLTSLLFKHIAQAVVGPEKTYSGTLRFKDGVVIESGFVDHEIAIEEITKVLRFTSGLFDGLDIHALHGHYQANAASAEADEFERDLRKIVAQAKSALQRAGLDSDDWTVDFVSLPGEVTTLLPAMAYESMKSMSMEEQHHFLEEYERRRKSVAWAYILWLLLGWHYAYLGKWGVMVLFWLTIGGLLVWWFIDLFRIPGLIQNHNKDIALDILRTQRLIAPPRS